MKNLPAALLALSVLAICAPALLAAPTPEEIMAMHQAAFDSIRSGRVTYAAKATMGPDHEKRMRDNMLRHADDSNRASLEEQARAQWIAISSDTQTRFVFDVDADAYLSRRSFVKSPDELMAEHNVSDTFVKSFSGDNWTLVKDDEQRTLSTSHNSYSISKRPDFPGFSPLMQHFSHSLLVGPMASSLQLSELVPDETDGNLYHAALLPDVSAIEKQMGRPFTEEELEHVSQARIEVTLDSSLGYRVVEMNMFQSGVPAMTIRTEFASFDDCILPQHTVMSGVDPDGNENFFRELTLLSAEINVPIDPSELTLDVPPGTSVSDRRTGIVIRPELEKARAQSLVPEVHPTEPADEPDPDPQPAPDVPAEIYPPGRAEPSPDPAPDIPADLAPTPSAPARPSAPPTPTSDRDHTLLIVISLAAALLATIALVLIRKGKRK